MTAVLFGRRACGEDGGLGWDEAAAAGWGGGGGWEDGGGGCLDVGGMLESLTKGACAVMWKGCA